VSTSAPCHFITGDLAMGTETDTADFSTKVLLYSRVSVQTPHIELSTTLYYLLTISCKSNCKALNQGVNPLSCQVRNALKKSYSDIQLTHNLASCSLLRRGRGRAAGRHRTPPRVAPGAVHLRPWCSKSASGDRRARTSTQLEGPGGDLRHTITGGRPCCSASPGRVRAGAFSADFTTDPVTNRRRIDE
jgi:hypothetical protein